MIAPDNLQSIGDEIAIAWSDGSESFVRHEALRAASPSAENQGETDVFGNRYGGAPAPGRAGVRVTNWEPVGNYAIRFEFSDGHRTGLYTFDYLRKLGAGVRP
ncbi:MAG TPA: DUF971 domain-containing protein [Opitutaceae bacterium]|jgi:DUF971 family protein